MSSVSQSQSQAADYSSTSSSAADIIHEPAMMNSYRNIPWPVRPSPGINYNFVTIIYLAGSAFAALFYALEKHIFPSLFGDSDKNNNTTSSSEMNSDNGDGNDVQDGGDAWKEFANGMEGMYLIFIPFIPCLLWSLIVRSYWLKETSDASKEKKEN
jgi:Na+/proline symporter